jgi:hypothetical protein
MSGDDEGFLRRWSRLKEQARKEEPPAEAPPPDLPATVAAEPSRDAGDKPDEKPFDPATLPPIESLTTESDYALFMRPEVPEALRRQALRRLWATDPVLSAPDGFDMHTLDYNAVPTFPEGVKTLYRIGQGMLDEHEAETATESAETAGRRQEDAAGAGNAPPVAPAPDAAVQQENPTEIKDSAPNKA